MVSMHANFFMVFQWIMYEAEYFYLSSRKVWQNEIRIGYCWYCTGGKRSPAPKVDFNGRYLLLNFSFHFQAAVWLFLGQHGPTRYQRWCLSSHVSLLKSNVSCAVNFLYASLKDTTKCGRGRGALTWKIQHWWISNENAKLVKWERNYLDPIHRLSFVLSKFYTPEW